MIGYSSTPILSAALKSASVKATRTITARLTITFVISLTVISSPILMLANPATVVAAAASSTPQLTVTNTNNKVDTSSHHANLPISSTLPTHTSQSTSLLLSSPLSYRNDQQPSLQNGGFVAQAALPSAFTVQSNNIVNTRTIYEVIFRTATTGTIKSVDVMFPAGTNFNNAIQIETTGIGKGSFSKSGPQTVTYTVQPSEVAQIPGGTRIRFELGGLINPGTSGIDLSTLITTRDAEGQVIDGPTATKAYTQRQMGTNDIANNAITDTKVSPTFMTSRLLEDNARGDSFGWNPDGGETNFIIIDEDAISNSNPVLINVGDEGSNSQCESMGSLIGFFTIHCANSPPEGSELRYTIINLPLR